MMKEETYTMNLMASFLSDYFDFSDAELADAQAKLSRGEITTESAIYKNAIGNAKAAAGRLEAAKKDHENNRKIAVYRTRWIVR